MRTGTEGPPLELLEEEVPVLPGRAPSVRRPSVPGVRGPRGTLREPDAAGVRSPRGGGRCAAAGAASAWAVPGRLRIGAARAAGGWGAAEADGPAIDASRGRIFRLHPGCAGKDST
jgi:hypothetical protein